MSMVLLFSSLFLFAILLILAANFSALETALFVLRERNLLPEEELPRSEKSKRLLLDTSTTLQDSMLLGSISNLALTATALYLILHPLQQAGFKPWLSTPIVLSASLLIVEILPRTCALRAPSRVARCTLPLLRFSRVVILPIARPVLWISQTIAGMLTRSKSRAPRLLDSDELPTYIDMRAEQGSINKQDADMLHGITSLRKLAARDLMTPRMDLPLMPHDAEEQEIANMLESARHPFVAVYDPKQDGVTHVIDVQRWKVCGRGDWKKASQPPIFVQETISLLRVWNDHLQAAPSAVVVIVNEFGGFQGLLTHKDVVNHVLAKTAPAPDTQANIQLIGAHRYLIAGQTRLAEIEEELNVNFNNDSVDTISGLVIALSGGVTPKPGQRLALDDMEIKIKRTARLRVKQLEIILRPAPSESAS